MRLLSKLVCLAIARASAIPFQEINNEYHTTRGIVPRSDVKTLTNQILAIGSGTSSCDSVNEFADECRTASEAAQPILDSFDKYQIANVSEQVALIALMLYESGEFKYNWGHFVSGEIFHTPGKGTRNMQSATYNEKYARTLFSSEVVDSAKSSSGVDGVLQLVSPDNVSFASAAWFLTSQCDSSIRSDLQAGTQDGFEQYISDCVGGTIDQERIDYWTKTRSALVD